MTVNFLLTPIGDDKTFHKTGILMKKEYFSQIIERDQKIVNSIIENFLLELGKVDEEISIETTKTEIIRTVDNNNIEKTIEEIIQNTSVITKKENNYGIFRLKRSR